MNLKEMETIVLEALTEYGIDLKYFKHHEIISVSSAISLYEGKEIEYIKGYISGGDRLHIWEVRVEPTVFYGDYTEEVKHRYMVVREYFCAEDANYDFSPVDF